MYLWKSGGAYLWKIEERVGKCRGCHKCLACTSQSSSTVAEANVGRKVGDGVTLTLGKYPLSDGQEVFAPKAMVELGTYENKPEMPLVALADLCPRTKGKCRWASRNRSHNNN